MPEEPFVKKLGQYRSKGQKVICSMCLQLHLDESFGIKKSKRFNLAKKWKYQQNCKKVSLRDVWFFDRKSNSFISSKAFHYQNYYVANIVTHSSSMIMTLLLFFVILAMVLVFKKRTKRLLIE